MCLIVVNREREMSHVPNDVQVVLLLVRVKMLRWMMSHLVMTRKRIQLRSTEVEKVVILKQRCHETTKEGFRQVYET